MSTSTILKRFSAGVFLANAVPHGVAGLQGNAFPSPFARPPGRGLSSPPVNITWSALNVAAGLALLGKNRSVSERIAVGTGALVMSLFLAAYFGSDKAAVTPR